MQGQTPRAACEAPTSGAILLVPGLCSPAEVLRPLQRRLERYLGRPSRIVSLGSACGDIRDLAERVHVEVAELLPAGACSRIDVVGHSMGGLIGAYLLKCLDQGRDVGRVVTLGTPHQGLALARLGSLLPGPLGRSLRQLRPGSSLLELLARLALPAGTELVSMAGLADAVVPPHATRLPDVAGHRNLTLPDVDHLGLVFSKRASEALLGVLGAAPFAAERPAACAPAAGRSRPPHPPRVAARPAA